ncbi:hypothetical protein HDV03_005468 [Kappamyces sp. JEL0829]|nr:hypothetical protein HDV03_005468 [Kappamyces sp. JEL0829]
MDNVVGIRLGPASSSHAYLEPAPALERSSSHSLQTPSVQGAVALRPSETYSPSDPIPIPGNRPHTRSLDQATDSVLVPIPTRPQPQSTPHSQPHSIPKQVYAVSCIYCHSRLGLKYSIRGSADCYLVDLASVDLSSKRL